MSRKRKKNWRQRFAAKPRLVRYAAYALAAVMLAGAGAFTYLYFSYARIIDERLTGERERTLPRVYARPFELRRGQPLGVDDLVARLNALGFAQRSSVEQPGEFTVGRNLVAFAPRHTDLDGRIVQVSFPAPRGADARPARLVQRIEITGRGQVDRITLDPPLLTALMTTGGREKRRSVPLSSIPLYMQQAVIAIEDQSFYLHPGVNPVRLVAALFTNLFGTRDQVVGNSTITQQLARMFFQADEFDAELDSGSRGRTLGSYLRYARGLIMSLVLERRATKDEILELYLNDVYLGQRGSFAIHGVAEAARLFFGKDVANLSLAEAALIAGTIRSPAGPFARPEASIERRNVVLRAMAAEGYISEDAAERASREPLQLVARAVDNEAPYFVDMIGQQVAAAFPGVTAQTGKVDVYTTLDLNLQRAALDAVRNGLANVDQLLARRRRTGRAQAALVAVDPRTGEILAMVGGRSYNASQYNRALFARRQPGSVFKPFVFLAAFERAAEDGRTDFTPAALAYDEPTTIVFGNEIWEPKNYDDYDGEITWRRALAMSRNMATIHVGEQVGFDRVAALWRRVGVGTPPQPFPSITLGVFELTPYEVAEAYTLFVNGGTVRPLTGVLRIDTDDGELRPRPPAPRRVARPETAFLVTNMMRSVLTEGTGAGARAMGFTHDAAGKSGTTNDQRDAWFVGFTPELLTVVWVGFDDNQPLSLTGTQAALPIWAEFMRTALGGRPNAPFEVPEGISFATIDRDTGKLALPGCPRTFEESFLAGTEPVEFCELHRW